MLTKMSKEELIEKVEELENEVETLESDIRMAYMDKKGLEKKLESVRGSAWELYKECGGDSE